MYVIPKLTSQTSSSSSTRGFGVTFTDFLALLQDLTDPLMVMFELPEEEQDDMQENTFEVKEAIPDVELFEYKTSTRSIHVVSGA